MAEPRKRSKRYLCKCKSYCTTFNPHTGTYEGAGQWLSRSSRAAHTASDKFKRLVDVVRHEQPNPTPPANAPLSIIEGILREVHWLSDLPVTSPSIPLSFIHDPASPEDSEFTDSLDVGQLALRGDRRANSFFLFTENRFDYLLGILSDLPPSDDRDEAAGFIRDALAQLGELKRAEWTQQRGRIPGRIIINTDIYFRRQGPALPVVKAAYILSLVLENLHFMTRRSLRVHLGGIRGVLRANGATLDTILSIPKDPRSCAAPFNLEPVTRQFISCIKCHCLYPYTPGDDENGQSIAPNCTHRSTPASRECQAPLWTARQLTGALSMHRPIRKYHHQDLKAWIGRLLSRKGMEELLDRPMVSGDPNAPVDDIWSGKVFRQLKDPRGQPFYPGPSGECRLVFGLSVDGFVPFGSKNQNASSTGIWLVLFNLPWHLRHLPQNIFLAGVIPGPDKPSLVELNHYLQLVVDDALQLWDPGVFLSRTYQYRMGRFARAMIALVICDHPGLRQVIGYASAPTAHDICVNCDLDKDDVHIVDRREWPTKDPEHIRRFATLWKNARSEKQQDSIFNACGWRWSALFDLPYWNPVLFSAVDSMHALDLNLFHNHCRTLFGIDIVHPGGDRSSLLSPTTNTPKVLPSTDSNVKKCVGVVKKKHPKMLYQLLECSRPALYTFCVMFNIVEHGRSQVIGTKWVLARNIHTWRLSVCDETIFGGGNDHLGDVPDEFGSEDDESGEGSSEDGGSGEENEDFLEELSQNENKAARVINHLVFESDQDHVLDSHRRKALAESWLALYTEICLKLSVVLPKKITRRELQLAIVTSIDADPAQRRRLALFVPEELRSVSGSDTKSETEIESRFSEDSRTESQMNTDTETETETDDDQSLVELRGKKRQKGLRTIRNLLVTDTTKKIVARQRALNSATLSLYREICETLDITVDPDHDEKTDLHAAILKTIDDSQQKYQQLQSFLPVSKDDAVLGKDVMEQVWKDMNNTQLPTWISSAPRNWGTAKRGTLSADNWRVICTIHLPITLIWLWRDEVGRKRDLLRNFMDLVTAARLACLRVSSPGQVAAYNKYITRYITGIQALYPAAKLKPTTHTSLHIGDGLENFGPDHTHNAAFYERFISFFHRINTNNKLGQVELTFLKFSARYSNLCAMLADDETLRNTMMDMMDSIDSINKEDLRGFRLASILDPNVPDFSIRSDAPFASLDDAIVTALDILQRSQGIRPVSRETFVVPEVALNGVRYGSHNSRHFRNSTIIYRLQQESQDSAKNTGIIQTIFRQTCKDNLDHESLQLYLVVDEHIPITRRGLADPYSPFGFAAGYLCENNAAGRHVISLTQVVSHFVMTRLPGTDYFHALPVDRLMLSFDFNEV